MFIVSSSLAVGFIIVVVHSYVVMRIVAACLMFRVNIDVLIMVLFISIPRPPHPTHPAPIVRRHLHRLSQAQHTVVESAATSLQRHARRPAAAQRRQTALRFVSAGSVSRIGAAQVPHLGAQLRRRHQRQRRRQLHHINQRERRRCAAASAGTASSHHGHMPGDVDAQLPVYRRRVQTAAARVRVAVVDHVAGLGHQSVVLRRCVACGSGTERWQQQRNVVSSTVCVEFFNHPLFRYNTRRPFNETPSHTCAGTICCARCPRAPPSPS